MNLTCRSKEITETGQERNHRDKWRKPMSRLRRETVVVSLCKRQTHKHYETSAPNHDRPNHVYNGHLAAALQTERRVKLFQPIPEIAKTSKAMAATTAAIRAGNESSSVRKSANQSTATATNKPMPSQRCSPVATNQTVFERWDRRQEVRR